MAGQRIEIKFVGEVGKYYPSLPSYPRGIEVNKDDTLKVTEKELKYFLRQENGHKPLFIENKKVVEKKVDKPDGGVE